MLPTCFFSGLAPLIMREGLLVYTVSWLADSLSSAGNGLALPEGKPRHGITQSKDDCSEEIPPLHLVFIKHWDLLYPLSLVPSLEAHIVLLLLQPSFECCQSEHSPGSSLSLLPPIYNVVIKRYGIWCGESCRWLSFKAWIKSLRWRKYYFRGKALLQEIRE